MPSTAPAPLRPTQPSAAPLLATKSIDWSYPTSENAARFGFANGGCFTISLNFPQDHGSRAPEGVSGHSTREEAVAVARLMQEPWNALHARLHPDEAVGRAGQRPLALHELTPFEFRALKDSRMLQRLFPGAPEAEAEALRHPTLNVSMENTAMYGLPRLRIRAHPRDERGQLLATFDAPNRMISVARDISACPLKKPIAVLFQDQEALDDYSVVIPKAMGCSMAQLARLERLLRARSVTQFRVKAHAALGNDGSGTGGRAATLADESAPTLEAAYAAAQEKVACNFAVQRGLSSVKRFSATRIDAFTVPRQFAQHDRTHAPRSLPVPRVPTLSHSAPAR